MAHSIEVNREEHARVLRAIIALAENPRPVGCKKLHGEDLWRIRAGDIRIVYEVYDDRLLVKPIPSAERYLTPPVYQLPYEGGKRMLLVEEVDDRDYLSGLFRAMDEELVGPSSPKKAEKKEK